MAGNARVAADELRSFVAGALAAVGMPRSDAADTARLIVLASLRGADGHGVFRVPQYVRRLRAGGINARPAMAVVREGGGTALIDGDNAMGHLVMRFAARTAIDIAKRTGVSWVGVRRSNHAGPGSLYAMMPTEESMLGLYFAVGNANHMAPVGGAERLLSTNPIAFAAPIDGRPPLVFDMATSVVAYGAVKQAAKRGETLPEGWMIDPSGNPLRDPRQSDEGLLLPAAGHKGYGLSLMVTVVAGVLNSAATGRDVVDFNHDDIAETNTGQAIIAVDIARFSSVGSFQDDLESLIAVLKASKRLPGVDEIRIPGERSHATFVDRSHQGIPIDAPLLAELNQLAVELGVSLPVWLKPRGSE